MARFAKCAITALLMAILAVGGCLACAFPAKSAKQCCTQSGKCKTTPERESQQCTVQPAMKSGDGVIEFDHAMPAVATLVVSFVQAPVARVIPPIEHEYRGSPPDLCVLHSNFRI